MKINSIEIIRNTKYAYYKIFSNGSPYFGVIDIESNQIIFNTNISILEIKPFSKNSLLVITPSSAYEFCFNGKYKGKCIDQCPPGQTLKIDPEKGNYCDGYESCNKYILKPNNTCTDVCDEDIYTLIEEKECGLCKDLNKSFRYKVKGEKFCTNKIPDQSIFDFNEYTYNIILCHQSCEKCKGEEKDDCVSCKDSILFKGECIENCPERFYEDKNGSLNICKECNTNCKTCKEGSEEMNNHCTSCEDRLFLINAKDMPNNCVEECPNNTITISKIKLMITIAVKHLTSFY